jgi:CO/xanthine dehydrogenase Mo-binding subunit
MDVEGYGVRPGQDPVDRLLEDCRTLSPAGIERVADGWQRLVGSSGTAAYHGAERAALRVLEARDRTQAWDDLRARLLGLTERGVPLIAWRQEHGEAGHRAEAALLGAALALVTGPDLDRSHRRTLLAPMAEALPWLLDGSAVPG